MTCPIESQAGAIVRCTEKTVVTSLDIYVNSVNPTDPSHCWNYTAEDYVGESLLMTLIDRKYYPLCLCGSTNSGLEYRGCSGDAGRPPDPEGTPLSEADCNWVATGKRVIAQSCIIDGCEGYHLDPTFLPLVTLQKIDGQWAIVGVISGDAVVAAGVLSQGACPGACCGVGVRYLMATVGAGCGAFSGESFELAGGGGGAWAGDITRSTQSGSGSETLFLSITCSIDEEGADDWAATAGCGGAVGAYEIEVICGAGTGSGSDSDTALQGVAKFSSHGCSSCTGDLEISFISIAKRPRDECLTVVETGEIVSAQACDLPDVEIDDYVIIAHVPKEPSLKNQTKVGLAPVTTGSDGLRHSNFDDKCFTGTGSVIEAILTEEPQWHIVSVCSNGIECEPCPPDPPPEDAQCCDLTSATVPQFLTGTIGIIGTGDAADCTCGDTIVFEWDGQSIPPVWNQIEQISCPGPTGTGTPLGLFVGMGGLSIQCATGESSGSGSGGGFNTGSGSGSGSVGFVLAGLFGCHRVDEVADNGYSCEPVFASFGDIDVVGCCMTQSELPITGTVTLSLAVSE